jgi:hypothetical protein
MHACPHPACHSIQITTAHHVPTRRRPLRPHATAPPARHRPHARRCPHACPRRSVSSTPAPLGRRLHRCSPPHQPPTSLGLIHTDATRTQPALPISSKLPACAARPTFPCLACPLPARPPPAELLITTTRSLGCHCHLPHPLPPWMTCSYLLGLVKNLSCVRWFREV